LQAVAGPDEVVIAPTTRQLLSDAFSFSDLGEHALKGIAQPIRVWRVDEMRRTEGRFKVARGGINLAPMLGRNEESMLLARCWQQARHSEGQVVLIGGQPGIGKSRLTEGFRDSITEPHSVLHCQCSPYHLNSPLHPFIEQFEMSAGFARADEPEEQLEKMEAALMESGAEVAGFASLYAALLSLPTDRYPPLQLSPRKQKEKTLEALISRVVALCSKSPVLMVLEDAHWIDPTSHELLEIFRSCSSSPIASSMSRCGSDKRP
jgi:predicted ATPase